jgi:molecular chaperone DnaK
VKDAEALLKEKDASKDALQAKAESLARAAQKLGEIMYAQSQQQAEAATQQAASGGGSGGGGKHEEKVVDAEFTEVKKD